MLEDYLRYYFQQDNFRPGQREVIEALLEGRDVFALWPTGAGKSLTYQLPALILPHLTLIISPLIALMQDQVRRLQQQNIYNAAYLGSDLPPEEQAEILDKIRCGKLKILFLSPERLISDHFLEHLRGTPVSLLAVDEAHCLLQWGYDFRPSYLQLYKAINFLKPNSIIALTATASLNDCQQISQQLGLKDPLFSQLSLDRPNLYYEVKKTPTVYKYNVALNNLISPERLPAVVYTYSRQQCEKFSQFLQNNALSSLPYHAGLSVEERQKNQAMFLNDEIKVIVATIAFGMGVDKPNIRQVIHLSPPNSPEGYYQESGRAGRDRRESSVLLLWDDLDFKKAYQNLEDKYPTHEDTQLFYDLIYQYPPKYIRSALAKLSNSSWQLLLQTSLGIDVEENLPFIPQISKNELDYFFAFLKRRDEERLYTMFKYCHTEYCRKEILLQAFDQQPQKICQHCDNCKIMHNS